MPGSGPDHIRQRCRLQLHRAGPARLLPTTSYETIYGSRYNYGGPNVVDYRLPELAYGLSTQPGIGMAEVVRLPSQIGYYQGGYESSGGGVSYVYGTSGGTASSYGYGTSSVEASSYGLAASDTLYLPSTFNVTGQAAALTADQILPNVINLSKLWHGRRNGKRN